MKTGGQIGDLTESCPSNARFTRRRVVVVMFVVVVVVVFAVAVVVVVVAVAVVVVGVLLSLLLWLSFPLLPPILSEKKDQL